MVRAAVSGSCGEAATTGVAIATALTENVNVPAHYTGWFRVDVYQQRSSRHAVTDRWNSAHARCVTQPERCHLRAT